MKETVQRSYYKRTAKELKRRSKQLDIALGFIKEVRDEQWSSEQFNAVKYRASKAIEKIMHQ